MTEKSAAAVVGKESGIVEHLVVDKVLEEGRMYPGRDWDGARTLRSTAEASTGYHNSWMAVGLPCMPSGGTRWRQL